MTRSPQKRFLAELHDVHPSMPVSIGDILKTFPDVPEGFWAWLVVPDWYDEEPLQEYRSFVSRLQQSPAAKVLHGWSHLRGRSLWHKILYDMEDRSEFAALNAQEAQERIERGRALLSTAMGVRPDWFCAPRWTLGKAARRGLAASNLPGVMGLRDLTWKGQGMSAPVLNFDVGGRLALRRLNHRGLQRRLSQMLGDHSLVRFVVHPIDLTFPETRDVMLKVFSRLIDEGWAPISLDEIEKMIVGRNTLPQSGR
ncbi:DUF2334 domain-containing protein [Hoeflea sp. WL0058]|uniref:DUF2334 domain-containing protein n=1 Tax=Flavimaribacter sediminis TaxID=2865987 RepID=A0AAE3D0J4_9HYPH|nr:DUF2334 domain-containing protein [Flavimaribacter sediminis]MBW8637764.1 DUF2334 domain-containing protein [Flavimaribacter sediminis]